MVYGLFLALASLNTPTVVVDTANISHTNLPLLSSLKNAQTPGS